MLSHARLLGCGFGREAGGFRVAGVGAMYKSSSCRDVAAQREWRVVMCELCVCLCGIAQVFLAACWRAAAAVLHRGETVHTFPVERQTCSVACLHGLCLAACVLHGWLGHLHSQHMHSPRAWMIVGGICGQPMQQHSISQWAAISCIT